MIRRPDIPKIFTNKILDTIFIIAVLFVLFLPIYNYIKELEEPKNVPTVRVDSLNIFIPSGETKLAEKKIEIKTGILSEKQKVDMIINELKKQKCLPAKLSLYDFATDDDGIMYLNLSKEILNNKIGTGQEITTTYAIVNSFISNLKGINRIQLLVEGQPAQTLNGLINIYKPIEFNKALLED